MTRNEKILNFYFTEKKLIHISCNNLRFYNGIIIELNIEKELLILDDKVIGPVPILFEEIKVVEPFREEGR